MFFSSIHIYPSLPQCQTHLPRSPGLRLPSPLRLFLLLVLSLLFFYLFIYFSTLKRKDRPDDPTPTPQEEEYEAGRVICQVCGTGIAFRDEATNEFTMKHWDARRLAWYYNSSHPRCLRL